MTLHEMVDRAIQDKYTGDKDKMSYRQLYNWGVKYVYPGLTTLRNYDMVYTEKIESEKSCYKNGINLWHLKG